VPWERCTGYHLRKVESEPNRSENLCILISVDLYATTFTQRIQILCYIQRRFFVISRHIFSEIEIRCLRPFQAICLQNENRDESQHSQTPFRRGWRIPLHRVSQHRAMLNMKNIPQKLWVESYNCAVYTLNRTLSSSISANPYELWFGRKPKIDLLRMFGCEAYAYSRLQSA
jgi:hypothetical protein